MKDAKHSTLAKSSHPLCCLALIALGGQRGLVESPKVAKSIFNAENMPGGDAKEDARLGQDLHFSSFVTNPAILCRWLANSPPSAKKALDRPLSVARGADGFKWRSGPYAAQSTLTRFASARWHGRKNLDQTANDMEHRG